MEVTFSSETSVKFRQNARHNISEDSIFFMKLLLSISLLVSKISFHSQQLRLVHYHTALFLCRQHTAVRRTLNRLPLLLTPKSSVYISRFPFNNYRLLQFSLKNAASLLQNSRWNERTYKHLFRVDIVLWLGSVKDNSAVEPAGVVISFQGQNRRSDLMRRRQRSLG